MLAFCGFGPLDPYIMLDELEDERLLTLVKMQSRRFDGGALSIP